MGMDLKVGNSLVVLCFVSVVAASASTVVVRDLNNRAFDLTLQAGATGEDVVDACLLKLHNLPIFANDFSFMKRIALVETNFGTNSILNGGIWQINQVVQTALNQYQFSSIFTTTIQVALNIDISDFATIDFSIPLWSALAARLFIYIEIQGNLPGSVDDQAAWWSANYNQEGVSANFVTIVTDFEANSGCTIDKMDLWFLVDGSGSVAREDFALAMQFVGQLSRNFEIAPDKVRTGFSTYTKEYQVVSRFDQHTSNTAFYDVVVNTSKPGGGTYTGAAIRNVTETGFTEQNGARPLLLGVPRVLIVMTDGQSHDNVQNPSENARDAGITVFGVGIGDGVVEEEIKEIANDPDSTYAFPLADFNQLLAVLQHAFEEQACQISVEIPDNTSVSTTVQPGDTHFCTTNFPSNGSIEITFEVTTITTQAIVYFSSDYVNPSAALYHFSVEITVGVTVVAINDDDLDGISLAQSYLRSKRATAAPKKLYFGVRATGDSPLELNYKAVGSETKAGGFAPKLNMCFLLWLLTAATSFASLA